MQRQLLGHKLSALARSQRHPADAVGTLLKQSLQQPLGLILRLTTDAID